MRLICCFTTGYFSSFAPSKHVGKEVESLLKLSFPHFYFCFFYIFKNANYPDMIHGFFSLLIPCLEYFLIPVKKEILLITVRILWSDVTFLPSLACAHCAPLHTEAARPLLQLQNLLLASGCISPRHHILET